MKTKTTLTNLKKIPYFLALTLLTAGASTILGFLSFSGMYALYPLLGLAGATFALSVAYEGEIYLQNIKGALTKLFKGNYMEHRLAKEYLLEHFPDNTQDEHCPPFFRDYKAQLLLLKEFEQKTLTKDSQKRRKHIEKTLMAMEHWFAQQLFSNSKNENQSSYASELQQWLARNGQEEWQQRIKQRTNKFTLAKGFSAFAALFMGLGSTYLIVEAFSVIPFFAAIPFAFWPALILPMAVIAGAAYGLLTYNAVTDLINNNTVLKWYNQLKEDLKQGLTFRNVFMTLTATFLVTLAVALTVCTAGTWWTIATNARPLFQWMSKMPSFIMGGINPIITGASAIFFNIQNSSESLDMVDTAMRNKKNAFQRIKEGFINGWNQINSSENWLQITNPFRILLKLTITPLRIVLFFGHLVSIALTSDRMPGVPQVVAALVAIISEGFEDAHYFAGGDSEASHEEESKEKAHDNEFKAVLKERLDSSSEGHGTDIPTLIVQTLSAPLYGLAAIWDSLASKTNRPDSGKKVLSLKEAWNKHRGVVQEETVVISSKVQHPSVHWKIEHTVSLIEQQKTQLTHSVINTELAQEKVAQLTLLQGRVRTNPEALNQTLAEEKKKLVYNTHRLFAMEDQTSTQQFIENLPEEVKLHDETSGELSLSHMPIDSPIARISCY